MESTSATLYILRKLSMSPPYSCGLEKDRYNKGRYRAETKEYTFEEYLLQHLGIDDEVKSYLDKQVDEVRQQVNRDVKAAFDESTKAMLSNASSP